MAYFCLRLIPPRPSFPTDMTPAERQVMMDHVAYWTTLIAERSAIAFGPVADPAGGWGLGLLEVEDMDAAQQIPANDPAITSGIGFTADILPMPRLILR